MHRVDVTALHCGARAIMRFIHHLSGSLLLVACSLSPVAPTTARGKHHTEAQPQATHNAPIVDGDFAAGTPESQGMSREKLDALKDELAKRKTRAFLVIRNDKIVYEWYAAGHGPKKKHGAAS